MVAIEQVQDCLIRSGLASETVVFGARRKIEAAGEPIDGELLIRHLLGEGRLTPFQAKRIREGRGLELVIGNYFILSRIGAGGMGIVYKALHRRMQRVVALKLIRKQKQQNADFIERFQREVQAAARLNHPHVIAAYDADECELGHYLVMEYVEGADLKEIVAKSGPFSAAEAIDAICQAAEGLHYAHSQRVVHRDVKPANLMRDVHGVVKIADMGLARLESIGDEEALASLTSDGIAAGTVDYLSPEQSVDTSSVDHRADIYSLGCTLFYILTGQPVFQRPSLIGRLMAHRQQPPPSLLDFNDNIPDGLDEVFQRMVAKDPADRYQSMAEVAEELAGLQPSSSIATVWDPERTSVLVVEPSKMLTAMIRRFLGEMNIGDTHLLSTGAAAINALETTPATVASAAQGTQHVGVSRSVAAQGRTGEGSHRGHSTLVGSEFRIPLSLLRTIDSQELRTGSRRVLCPQALPRRSPFTTSPDLRSRSKPRAVARPTAASTPPARPARCLLRAQKPTQLGRAITPSRWMTGLPSVPACQTCGVRGVPVDGRGLSRRKKRPRACETLRLQRFLDISSPRKHAVSPFVPPAGQIVLATTRRSSSTCHSSPLPPPNMKATEPLASPPVGFDRSNVIDELPSDSCLTSSWTVDLLSLWRVQ